MKLFILVIGTIAVMIFPLELSAHSRKESETDRIGALFTITGLLPGTHVQKSIRIINKHDNSQKVSLRATLKNSRGALYSVLMFSVLVDKGKWRSFPFAQLFGPNPTEIVMLKPRESRVLVFDVEMPATAGNAYQQSRVAFDLFIALYSDADRQKRFWRYSHK